MSIQVVGSLQVIARNGRNGAFTVGELSTEIGKFRIKHKVLDDFEEGKYEGSFLITRVFNLSNVTTTGQVWGSLCADLDWDALRIMNQSETVESETLEATATLEEVTETLPENTEPEPIVPHSDDNLVSDLSVLAQMLEDGAAEIKLDSTLEDRSKFRELLNVIKASRAYRFDPNGQKWGRIVTPE